MSLRRQFPDDDSCLEFIFNVKHPRECSCGGMYRRISGRRQFQCSKCRFQIAPASGTIFHKSDTPLVLWFHAILAFFNAKGEISAKQLERDLEISYKCAWRILGTIRRALGEFIHKNSRDMTYTDALFTAIKTRNLLRIRTMKKKRRMSGKILA